MSGDPRGVPGCRMLVETIGNGDVCPGTNMGWADTGTWRVTRVMRDGAGAWSR